MMNRLRIFLRGIDPALEHFQYEKIISVHKTGIDHLALEIGETFGYQRRSRALCLHGRQMERFEFIDVAARAVANFDDYRRRDNKIEIENAVIGRLRQFPLGEHRQVLAQRRRNFTSGSRGISSGRPVPRQRCKRPLCNKDRGSRRPHRRSQFPRTRNVGSACAPCAFCHHVGPD